MSVLVDATPDLNRPLAATDPEVAAAIAAELRRQQTTLEMIASENFAPVAGDAGAGLGAHEQVRRGLPGQALLRRLRARRRDRAAGDRPAQGAVRRRVRQRPAALRRSGQRGGDGGAAAARRHDPRARPRPRRSPDARHAAQLLRQALRRRRLPRRPRRPPRRHGRGRAAGARTPAQAHRRGLVGLPPAARLRRVPADRRRGRRLPHGRHGALRGTRRDRPAPVARAARPRGHLHHAQDARRSPRRVHPRERRAREEVQLLGVPRPAGRPAGARHRGQGRGVQARGRARVRASARSAPSPVPGSSPTGCSPTTAARPGSAWSAAAPTCTWCWPTCASRRWTAAGRGPAARHRHHREPQRGALRPAAPDGQLRRPHRHPRAGRPRLRRRRLHRGRRHHRPGAAADPRGDRARPGCGPGSPTSPSATRSTRT